MTEDAPDKPDPQHEWLENPKLREQVAKLLEQQGLPLEVRVSHICHQHEGLFHALSLGSSTYKQGRVVYNTGTTEGALREVDQVLSVSAMSGSCEALWINVLAEVAIECKHRDGMMLFVFPEQDESWRVPAPPIASEFGFHATMRKIIHETPFLKRSPIGPIGMITGRGGQLRLSEEEFIYKAGASLYDYVHSRVDWAFADELPPMFEDLGLLERFERAEKSVFRDAWEDATSWIRGIAQEEALQERLEKLGEDDLEALFVFMLPVICVDGPIYEVRLTEAGTIGEMTPVRYARTRARLPKWPGEHELLYAEPSPEALLTVVSVDDLADLLDAIASWCERIVRQLYEFDDGQLAFQMLFMQRLRRQLRSRRTTGFWHL